MAGAKKRKGKKGGRGGGSSGANQSPKNQQANQGGPKYREVSDEDVTRHENSVLERGGTREKPYLDSRKEPKLPKRPAYGNAQPVKLKANYVQLLPPSDLVLYRYAITLFSTGEGGKQKVELVGKKLVQVIRLLLEDEGLEKVKDDVATDFKSTLISRKKLPEDESTYCIKYRNENEDEASPNAKKYDICLRYTRSLNISTLLDYLNSTDLKKATPEDTESLLQAFNIFLNHHAKKLGNQPAIGSSKMFPLICEKKVGEEEEDLGSGLMAIRGFFSSVRVGAGRILVNVQVTHAVFFRAGPLEDLMICFLETNGKEKLGRFLNRLRVKIRPQKDNKQGKDRVKTIVGLANRKDGEKRDHPPRVSEEYAGPKEIQFYFDGTRDDIPSGDYITVFDYSCKVYGNLKFPDLPVIKTGGKGNPAYFPAEVCTVLPGQCSTSKLDSSQTKKMIKFAVRTPADNCTSIEKNGLGIVGLDSNTNPLLDSFKIKVDPSLITVPSRVLPEPKLFYKKAKNSVTIRNGHWDLASNQFHQCSNSKAWSYLRITSPRYQKKFLDENALKSKIKDELLTKLKELGLDDKQAKFQEGGKTVVLPDPQNPDRSDLEKMFKEAVEYNWSLLLVVLPRASTLLYNRIKQLGDMEYGIHTICTVEEKFADAADEYLANLDLKFNLKLGGINHTIQTSQFDIIDNGTTMIVGLDVTHPSPGSNASSVAGMVGSIDRFLGQWPATVEIQTSRQEKIDKLELMLERHLRLWKRDNKSYPQNIIVYRDGVSESQYSMVVDKELPLLKQAADKLYSKGDRGGSQNFPRFTIVIAGKRHKTRFYPIDEKDKVWPNGNPKPGTVVDRGVTQPRN